MPLLIMLPAGIRARVLVLGFDCPALTRVGAPATAPKVTSPAACKITLLAAVVKLPAFRLRSEPEELMMTLPAVAVIDEAAPTLRAPSASESKSPLAVTFEPVKLRAPVLLRKIPLEAHAETLATGDISRRLAGPVPIEPLVEVRLSWLAVMVEKLPFTMLLPAVRSTVPLPAPAESEPTKLRLDPLRMTLPVVAAIDE